MVHYSSGAYASSWLFVVLVFVSLYTCNCIFPVANKHVDYMSIHCVSKNDTDVAHYNYDVHEGILIIFGIYVTMFISN